MDNFYLQRLKKLTAKAINGKTNNSQLNDEFQFKVMLSKQKHTLIVLVGSSRKNFTITAVNRNNNQKSNQHKFP
jgi:hypothetical protein